MSKKFFRPPPTLDDDSEDDDDDESEDERQPKANANLSSSEDEDEEPAAKPNKRKASPKVASSNKKHRAPSLFDDQAESDDDDSEEDIGDGEHMDQTMLDMIRQQDRERGRRGGILHEATDIEETAQAIERRHQAKATTNRGSTAPSSSTGMIPSNTDPSLWMISCSTGKEQDLVYQLMNKCIVAARQRRPMAITSIICAQSKGKLYIESYSEPAVLQLLQGVRNIMPSTKKKVPINDMVAVMTVKPSKKPVQTGDWVRMTRGHYKGDLALVRATKESGLKCIVQCVPRLDLAALDMAPDQARIRRKTVRPAQKFFSAQEIASLGRHTQRQRHGDLDTLMCDYFESNFYHDGYLLKEMTVGGMVVPITSPDDQPTLDELQRFQHRPTNGDNNNGNYENEGSKSAASLMDQLSALQSSSASTMRDGGLAVGDTIEVTEGDLVGLRGKIVSLSPEQVSVLPDASGTTTITEAVDFLPSQVRKYIPVGCHVKVMEGHYANETGTVVAVKAMDGDDSNDCTAIVLTDITNNEISVRTSQLRESTEIASGIDRLAGYELYDLVMVTGGGATNEVGIIVRVGREDFTIVINQSTIRENVRPEALRGKRNAASNRAVTMDAKAEQIRSGDTVGVTEGVHKGKTATVKRMHRSVLFLHSQTRTQHAGIFVVRAKSCILTGSRAVKGGGDMGDPFRTPGSVSTGGARGGGGGPGGGRRGADDGLMGKTVRIQAGQWKGHIGIVCDTTATHVQVELHARLKKVMVVRDRVVAVGDKFGSTGGNAVPESVFPTAASTMATPMVVMGGATPAIHGFAGATPSHDPDDSEEVWRPAGSSDIKEETNNHDDNDNAWGVGSGDTSPKDDAGNDGWGAGPSNGSEWGAGRESGTAVKHEDNMEDDVPEELPPWFVERVHVEVKSTGKEAVIKEITGPTTAHVQVVEDGSFTSVSVSGLSMQAPKEQDVVLVTGGTEVGLEGSLVCVDGSDAILKNANDEFKIIEFVHLAKIGDGGTDKAD